MQKRKLNGRHRAALLGAWLGLCLGAFGCAPGPAEKPASSSAETKPPSMAPAPPSSTPADIPVGDDPAASLDRVATAAKAAFDKHYKVEKLIYPRGYYRYQPAVLTVVTRLEQVGADPSPAGVVEIVLQDRNTLIRATQAEATTDPELHPRTPAPTHEEMFNDFSNAELKPSTITVQYQARNGVWRRVDWQGNPRAQKGADWLDRVGVP